MLKLDFSVKDTERRAAEALQDLLREIPALEFQRLHIGSNGRDTGVDLLLSVKVAGESHLLVGEVKLSGQPRYVRDAIYPLRNYIAHLGKPATPVIIAPYLSPSSRTLCREHGVSFLDFEGNAHLTFNTVYIDRSVAERPSVERRELKSIFTPKSARVLRVLFRDPRLTWRVTELAEAASVSLGHVSNVRTALRDREWAEIVPEGLRLKSPGALLDAWKAVYEPPVSQSLRFYTTLHGAEFDRHARAAFAALPQESNAALASYSAAHWIAPYARTGTQFFYADAHAVETLERELKLSSTAKGENIIVSVPKDEGVFLDVFEPAPGMRVTSPLQTYLDLAKSGERGEEAAEHLRHQRLIWPN